MIALPAVRLAMRLALQFGCTLQELGERMTAQEFGWWAALWDSEPWGDFRADVRAGSVAATVAAYAGRIRDDSAPAPRPSDFMPYLRPVDAEPDDEPDPGDYFRKIARARNA